MESSISGHFKKSNVEAQAPEDDGSNAPSTLLSLTGKVDDLLLRYVASGDGGLQAVLNLRQTCSTTKGWVDGLPTGEGKRLFRKCVANVDLSSRNLEDFLSSPPPKGVTSLSIGFGSLFQRLSEEEKEKIRLRMNPGLEKALSSFVDFWSPKLEALEFKTFGFSHNPSFRRLCTSSPEVRSFRCRYLDYMGDDFLKFLAQLEEFDFRVDALKIDEKRQLYNILSRSKKLQRFEATLKDSVDKIGITQVLDANRENSNFKATLKFEQECIVLAGFPLNGFVNGMQIKRHSEKLLNSIGTSKSSIRLVDFDDSEMGSLTALMMFEGIEGSEDLLPKFNEKVEGIREYNADQALHHFVGLANYRNLKRLECLSGQPDSLRRIDLPLKMEHLGVKRGIVLPQFLPVSITSLLLNRVECTLNELWVFLKDLAQRCPRLEALKIQWTRTTGSVLRSADLQPLPKTSFMTLKSLAIEVHFPGVKPNDVVLFRKVLLDCFKVPQLPLLRLFNFTLWSGKWKEGKRVNVLDSETLSSILKGRVMESLLQVELDEMATTVEAHPLRLKLMAKASANKAKREESHGRPLRLETIFLFP